MAGELRISMLIEANAQRAKAEVASMREEVAKLAPAGQEAGAGMDAVSDGAAEWGSAVQMLRASLQPMVTEANALAAAADQLAVYEEAGALSAREAAVAHDLLARQAIELQARMEAAGVTLEGTTAAARQHDTAVQQLIARNTGLSRATEESIADHLRHGQALDQLRARFDPLFAASRQYELALEEIAEAERQGAISAQIAAAARERLAQSMEPASVGVDRFGRSNQVAAQYAGQLSYQLNDIGMMMALGQSPFMLMMQQGPQVVQVFGQMRLAGIGLGAALRGALGMVINPLSLATMAVIGFGAAAVQHFTAVEEDVESLEDAVGGLTSRLSSYRSAMDDVLVPMGELRREWGLQAVAVRELHRDLADLERVRALRDLRESTRAVREEFAGLADRIYNIDRLMEQQAAGDDITFALRRELQSLNEEFGVSEEEARRLLVALNGIAQAEGPDQVAAATAAARTVLMDIVKLAGSDLPEGFYAAVEQIIAAEQAARSLAGPLKDSESYARSLASVDMASGVAAAGREALFLAQQLGVSLATAQAIAGASTKPKPRLGFGLPGAADPIIGGHAGLSFGDSPGSGSRDPGFNPYVPPSVTPPVGGGGAGGGGTSEIEKQRDALKSLREEQERQIALLRTTNPVQRIILENHEALAGATKEEKAAVVELILERERLEEIRDKIDDIGQTGKSAFAGLISGAHSFSDALSMLIGKLAEMLANDAWDFIWDGGGSGWGGLSGMVGEWLGLADGGYVSGPGGPRDDLIPAWLSNGEFVNNAESTARNRPLLEALNGGARLSNILSNMPGGRPIALADGGYLGDLNGSSAPSSWTRAPAGQSAAGGGMASMMAGMDIRLFWDRKKGDWSAEMTRVARAEAAGAVGEGLDVFSSHVLPGRLQEINANPRVMG